MFNFLSFLMSLLHSTPFKHAIYFPVLLQGIINLFLGLRPSRLGNRVVCYNFTVTPTQYAKTSFLPATKLSGITSQNPRPSEDQFWYIFFLITFSERDFGQHYGSSDFYFDRETARSHWTLLRVCHPLVASHETVRQFCAFRPTAFALIWISRTYTNTHVLHIPHSGFILPANNWRRQTSRWLFGMWLWNKINRTFICTFSSFEYEEHPFKQPTEQLKNKINGRIRKWLANKQTNKLSN